MNDTPLVSIVVPVYNAEKYIKQTIQSILDQTYSNIEIIIVDDGSTDLTRKLAEEISENNSIVKVISKINNGCPSARNEGIKASNGDFIQFVDADDSLQREMVEKMVSAYKNTNADLVVCGHNRNKYCDYTKLIKCESGKLWKTGLLDKNSFIMLFKDIAYGRTIGWEYTWDKLYRRDIIEKYHILYDESLKKYGDDSQFSLDYINYSRNIYLMEDCLYNFRINIFSSHITSQTSGYRENLYQTQLITLRLLRDFLEKNNLFFGENKRGYEHMYVNEAIKAIYLNYRADNPHTEKEKREIILNIQKDQYLQKSLKHYRCITEGESTEMPILLKSNDEERLFKYLERKVREIYG